jgi:DNA-binding GntR family transcriptional regulator
MQPVSRAGSRTSTEAERVYELLKEEILSSKLSPGTALRQADIAQRLETSRTPVREAVARLAADGLVQMVSRQGATVRQLSIREFLDINQLRWLLEGFAAGVAADQMPELEAIRLLDAINEAGASPDPRTVDALDQLVHRTIAAHCSNSRLRALIHELNDTVAIARVQDLETRHTVMIESLRSIVEAIRERDRARAETLMRTHIQEFTQVLPALMRPSAANFEEAG